MSEFRDRVGRLLEEVGHGELIMAVEVDQVYAHYQHERFDLRHPRGGKAFFLRDPLFNDIDAHMRTLADAAVTDEGSHLKLAGVRVAEKVAEGVFTTAPVEFGPLRDSAHPTVTSAGRTVYDRPPVIRRLTAEELKALRRGAAQVIPGARQTGLPRPR